MPDIKISQLPAATAAARTDELEANQSGTSRKVTGAQVAMLTPKGYIYGLDMEWISATSIRITSGAAHIESLGRVVELDAAITVSSISLGANAWGHAYLWLNGTTPAIEIVTTAPAAAYFGSARSKTGDATRRYLGSVRTDGSGNILNFLVTDGTHLLYRNQQDSAQFRLLNNGVATTETSVSLASVVPPTSRAAIIRITNASAMPTNSNLYTGTSDDSASGPPFSGIVAVGISSNAFVAHPVNSSQAMTYWYSTAPASTGGFVDVYGYIYDR